MVLVWSSKLLAVILLASLSSMAVPQGASAPPEKPLSPKKEICHEEVGLEFSTKLELIRIVPRNRSHVEFLKDLGSSDAGLDFWKEPTDVGSPVVVLAGDRCAIELKTRLETATVPYTVLVKDLDSYLLNALVENGVQSSSRAARSFIIASFLPSGSWSSSNSGGAFSFDGYYDSSAIYEQLYAWQQQYGSDYASVTSIGTSVEGNDILMLRISAGHSRSRQDAPEKPLIVIDAGMHGREWIGPATAMFIASELLASLNYSVEADSIGSSGVFPASDTKGSLRGRLAKQLGMYDWVIIPVWNPDGYDFSHQSEPSMPAGWLAFFSTLFSSFGARNRFWRKNRAANDGICHGVDLNRNFDYAWDPFNGASPNPCEATYAGTKANSEPETRALSAFLRQNENRIAAVLNFHSHGRVILTPWGYTENLPESYGRIYRAAKAMRDEISRVARAENRQSEYSIDSAARGMYLSSGMGIDFAHGALNITNAMIVELPGSYHGTEYAFLLPPRYIREVGRETAAGVTALAEELSATGEFR